MRTISLVISTISVSIVLGAAPVGFSDDFKNSNAKALLIAEKGPPDGSAKSSDEDCKTMRSARKAGEEKDFTHANFKGGIKKPPVGTCNKGCKLCPNPTKGGLWCDICDACWANVE